MGKIIGIFKNVNEVKKVQEIAITHQLEVVDARLAAVEEQQLQVDSSKLEVLL